MLNYKFYQFINYLSLRNHRDKIFFFIEDKNMDGIYERLFKKLFSNYKIEIFNANKICKYLTEINTGGKDALLILKSKLNLEKTIILKINYRIIIDPDFQIYFNKPEMIEDSNTFYLRRYCFENYIIDKETILKCIQVYYSDKIMAKIKQDCQIDNWFNSILKNFGEIFSYLAFNYIYAFNEKESLVFKFEFSMKNIPVFFKHNSFKINDEKVKEYFKILKKRYLLKNPNKKEKDILDFTTDFINKISHDPVKFICGKHLYHSLHLYLKKDRKLTKIPKNKNDFLNALFFSMIDNRTEDLFNFLN